MDAQQTFIIEASQQNSVEAPTTENYSAWTNRVEPTLLRRGDYISLNTAIVSQRGASGASNIEFTDEYNNDRDNLQSNFTLMKIGYYLCNNNVNSCPMPFKYARRQSNNSNPDKKTDGTGRVRTHYNTDIFKEIDGNQVVNQSYLLGVWNDPFRPKSDQTPNDFTCDALSTFENRNPNIKIDGARYAKVSNLYNGWERNDSGDNQSTMVDLLTQDIPLHIEKGFKDARSVGETLTRTLQTTNEPYSNDAEYAVPQSILYTIAPNETAQKQNNPRFNGYCMKSIGANLQQYNPDASNPLYNNLCVKDPFTWKFGTQLLSNTETNPLNNNGRINTNYMDRREHTNISYPVLLWSAWDQASPVIQDEVLPLAKYTFYSPFFTDPTEAGGEGDNVLEWSGFTGVMSDYNDYYPELYNYDDDTEYTQGTILFKNGLNSYYIYNPPDDNHTPKDPEDEDKILRFLTFIDSDNVLFDRVLGYNIKNSLGSEDWFATGEDLARQVEEADFFTTMEFGNSGADDIFYNLTSPYQLYSWIFGGISGGTTGDKTMWNVVVPPIVSGKTYTISFTTENVGSVGTGSSYAHAVGVVDRTADFGMSGMSITADGDYTQKFTATATYTATDGIKFFYTHAVPFNQEILLTKFAFVESSLQDGDEYTIQDIFYQPSSNTQYSTKIYKMTINSLQLRNEKVNITESTIDSGFNIQYTPVAENMTAYIAGSDVIAFNASHPNDHQYPVILINQDDPTYDYLIFNKRQTKIWQMVRINKFDGGEIVSGTILGTIDTYSEELKNPYRSNQQYYDFSVGNGWDYETEYVDLELGNGATGWNTASGGGGNPYICNNILYQQSTISITTYSLASGNTYTSTSPTEEYTFTDTSGTRPNGFKYDYTYQRTNPVSPNIVYLNSTFVNGLGGNAQYDTGGAAIWTGTWTLTTTGGDNGYGRLTLTASWGTEDFNPNATLTSTTESFGYDYYFDGTNDLYLQADRTGDIPYATGDYRYITNTGTELDRITGRGTFTYNAGTGQIQLTDSGSSAFFSLFYQAPGVIPGTTRAELTATITSVIAQPLPSVDTGSIVEYFATTSIYTSLGLNPITIYIGANDNGNGDDTDKQGQRGRIVWNDGGWSSATWDWNGGTYIDMDIGSVGNTRALYYQGSAPSLTDIVEYNTAQRITLGATPYDYPLDGRQYGLGATRMGTTEKVVDLHNPLMENIDVNNLYLSIGNMNEFDGYSEGKVYSDIDETDTNNAVADWNVIFNNDNTCDLKFFEVGTDTLLFQLSNQSSNVVKYGWVLFKCDKYNRDVSLPDRQLNIQDGEDYYSGATDYGITDENGRFLPNGTYDFGVDSGTSNYLGKKNVNQTHATLPKNTMLMTNIKYNIANLEIVNNYFRQTEIYEGVVESSRSQIIKDTEKFYANFQIGRTNDDKLSVDATTAPYDDDTPAFQYYMNDYGAMGVDDSDVIQFTDPDGNERKGSQDNFGCVCPKMKSKTGHRQNIDVFTRYKGNYSSRLIAPNRLSNRMGAESEYFENAGWLYGKEITEADFKKQYPDLYQYVYDNNVGVYPFLLKDLSGDSITYDLCMAFETYRDIDRDNANLLKIQDLSWFGFSPSFLDNDYITPINTDTPYLDQDPPDALTGGLAGYTPNYIQEYNMNLINIGSAPVLQYDPDLNRFQFNYFHTPFKFNETTGVDADLGEEVALLNSDTLMIMKQGIRDNNLESGGKEGDSPEPARQVHLGVADAQAGIYIMDIYGQTPSSTYITNSDDGTLITRNSYDNTLFYTLGFSYYDLKPIRFKRGAFNNRFNPNTFNTITTNFRALGTSPFTTNSAISISDQIKTNIYTGVNLHRTYASTDPYEEEKQLTANTNEGTPSFYLGYNSLLPVSIKTTSANMTSRSVIVQLQAPFYRVYCDLPLDTMSYLTDGSLSCVGYMTKNYQSQSFIYSFASDYGGYLTRDVLLTNLRTEIRNPKGLLVSSLDPNSAIFYKVVRNIKIQPGLTPKQEEEQTKQLLERQQQEAEEATEERTISLDVVKYFKQLFSGLSTNAMTEMLGEPSGVDEIYVEAQIEEKEEEAIEVRPVIPTLNLTDLDGMTEEEASTPYDTRQHRLFVRMSEIMEDALLDAQTRTPTGVVDLVNLDKELRELQLGGSVLDKLIKGVSNINNRGELRKLVEDTIGDNPNEYTTIRQRKKKATKILKVLEKAQEISIIHYPNLMGKNPVGKGRKKRRVYTDPATGDRSLITEKQKEKRERSAMIKQDKERRGRPSARKLLLRAQEGSPDSPARVKGRRILEEREKSGRGRELFKDTKGGGASK